jgi:hypothetical protein
VGVLAVETAHAGEVAVEGHRVASDAVVKTRTPAR